MLVQAGAGVGTGAKTCFQPHCNRKRCPRGWPLHGDTSARGEPGWCAFKYDDDEWVALRYDLTAPLSRYVAKNFQELGMPFRRYQTGPVWRLEKPEPGRFREFTQLGEDPLQPLACVLQVLRLEVDGSAVRTPDQEEAQRRRAVRVDQDACLELVAERGLGHPRIALGDLAAAALHEAVV